VKLDLTTIYHFFSQQPKQVRDRLLAMEDDKKKGEALVAPTHRLKTFLNGQNEDRADQPIADFFPHCTGK